MLRFLFFALIVRPFLLVVIGLNVRRWSNLPADGPAILVANHNSHLDTFVLMCLFSLRKLPKLRPVAAMDYFLTNRFISWFSRKIIGIIPIDRNVKSVHKNPLDPVSDELNRGGIVILFPEGSRGEPEQLGQFKTGVAHLAKRHPEINVYPIYMHGLGKSLPRGEALLVPFFCDVFVGEPFVWPGDKNQFMETLTCRMNELAKEGEFSPWE